MAPRHTPLPEDSAEVPLPLRIAAVSALIFIAETTVHSVLSPGEGLALLDGALAAAVSLPPLWWWLRREQSLRRRSEDSARLLKSLTEHFLTAEDLPSALGFALREICSVTGWALGEAWVPSNDSARMEFAAAWTSSPQAVGPFIEASRSYAFEPGIGLPGRVWASKLPAWVQDVTQDANFPRRREALAAGLKGGMAVPVMAEGRVIMVLGFFVFEPRPKEDSEAVALVSSAAAQLGGFVLRKQAEDQLRQSQKMEALGLLAGGVAHDFNNILTLIMGYDGLLRGGLDPGSPLCGYADSIMKGARNAATLTNQLLVFSRRQAVAPRVLDLGGFVAGSMRLLRRLLSQRIEMRCEASATPCRVTIDPAQLEQVIMNLVVNARDAMPEGGQLVLRVHASGAFAELSVQDTGTGMTPSTRARIFEPFFTTKEPGKGTGLGLSMVSSIIRQAGGRVEVESESGKGSCFRVLLPLSAEESGTQSAQSDSPPRRGRETVLVAESNEELRELIGGALRRHGYSPILAGSGDEALRMMGARPKDVALLLTDLVLPGLDASGLARRARSWNPSLKALYMSGSADIDPRVVLPPDAELIRKPFTQEELLDKVGVLLDA